MNTNINKQKNSVQDFWKWNTIKLQHVHNQHTIPKCYLKNFSDDGYNIFAKKKVTHVNDDVLIRELKPPLSLKQATVIKDFYTTKFGLEPMAVEKMFYANLIERNYPCIYKSLINPQVKGITIEERDQILSFFFSLHLRTPRQFNTFFDSIPVKFQPEIELIKEDYKAAHLLVELPRMMQQHEYKSLRVMKIINDNEFFTCDNPVLVIDAKGNVKNHQYEEWFNRENKIVIPLDKKHCLVLINIKSKDGVDLHGKVYANTIDRIAVDDIAIQTINFMSLWNADKYYYGSEHFIKSFFTAFKLKVTKKKN